MLKIKEFNSDDELNKFIEENKKHIKDNYSIETYKLNASWTQYCKYSKEVDYVVVPREIIKYILKYETIED